jgi:hypothetical protein
MAWEKSMPRWTPTALLLSTLLVVGCPPPPSQKTQSSGSEKSGSKSGAANGPDGSGEGGAEDEDTTPWRVLPKELVEDEYFYPQLKTAHIWPAPAALRPLSEIAEGKRPKPIRATLLRELVELLVVEKLRPKDSKAALGVDEKGRVFMKLGRGKVVGSASLETRPPESKRPIFAMTLRLPAKGPHTLKSLRKRVAAVVSSGLAAEMAASPKFALDVSPRAEGPQRVAGMALLDRSGKFGIQFPYLYAYADDQRVVVLLQEVPHMSAPSRGPQPEPGGE